MNLEITLILIGGLAVLFAFSAWRASRPSRPGQVRMVPWMMIALISGTAIIILLAHVLDLLGFEYAGRRRM